MLQHLKLSAKLWGMTGLLLIAVVTVASTSIVSINGILASNQQYASASDHDLFITEKEVDHLAWLNRLKDMFLNKLDQTDVQIDHTQCGLGKFIYGDDAKAMIKDAPELAGLLDELEAHHLNLHKSASLINQTVREAGHDKALEVFGSKTLPALKATQATMKTIADKLQAVRTTTKTAMEKIGARSIWTAIAASFLAFLVGGLMSALVIRSITRPVLRITSGLNRGAEEVASASGQISASSQTLAEGSSEQAAAIEETSSSLEEMASMTQQNADNAGQADQLMKAANGTITSANRSIEDLTQSMEEIAATSEKTQKIVKTIDEIAFQTNLLALNAAVEAARAGEAGAGFAVVADEVRNLAIRAAEAAKDTSTLIEESVKKINSGWELMSTTNTSFSEVATSAGKVTDLVAEISAASREQSQGIEQINRAVTEMDKVVQQTAGSAEENASASEEMSAQAEEMKAMVNELIVLVNGRGNASHPSVSVTHASGLEQSVKKIKRSEAPAPAATAFPVQEQWKPAAMIPFEDNESFKGF